MLDGHSSAPGFGWSMNAHFGSRIDPERWTAHRWWVLLGLVLVLQVGLIFWLGDQGPVLMESKTAPLALHVAGTVSSELLALNDPTLFALPHRQSFAGLAWLTTPSLGAQPFVWSEPPQWLRLSVEQLGGVFHNFLVTNQAMPSETLAQIEPELTFPEVSNNRQEVAGSTFHILGDLTEQALLTSFSLGSWTNADLLTNSIVQLLVNEQGRSVSVTLLANSGSSAADRFALKQAESARFAPVPLAEQKSNDSPGRLRWCQIIFDWHTVPLAPTNQPGTP